MNATCPFCTVDTAGNHTWDCPMRYGSDPKHERCNSDAGQFAGEFPSRQVWQRIERLEAEVADLKAEMEKSDEKH